MGKPAARINDMHTCPMYSGDTPHVGGPVLPPGAPTVFIGGVPAARAGDRAMCTGPPDTVAAGSTTVFLGGKPAARQGDRTAHGGVITMGCPTVLIGDSGGSSAGVDPAMREQTGAASASTGRKSQHEGQSQQNDSMIHPDIKISNLGWDRSVARRGDLITLSAVVSGAEDGTPARIEIWEHDQDGRHDFTERIYETVENGRVEAKWEFEYQKDTDDIQTEEESERGYTAPEYFFEVTVGEVSEQSGLVEFKDWIEFQLIDPNGNPIGNEPYLLTLPDGSIREGQLDKEGRLVEKDIPPGRCSLEFKNIN